MRTIVNQDNLEGALAALSEENLIVLDCETTGLSSFHNSKMFSLAMTAGENSYYFDFTKNLVYQDLLPLMEQVKPERVWVGHNVKFDMHFCEKAGILPKYGTFVDTKALARIYENKHQPWVPGGGYSLDACSRRWLDQVKDDRVKAWMDENGAFETATGNKKNYRFDLVPFEIVSEYAMIDTEVTLKLYHFLIKGIGDSQMAGVESALTKVLFNVEQRGLLLDVKYVEKARAEEQLRLDECVKTLPEGFIDSAKFLSPLLLAEGFDLKLTESGEYRVDDQALREKESDLATAVLRHRELSKRIGTYWDNFLNLIDRNHVIHPTLDSAGTVTGRMSSYNPNFQNIPSEDESDFPVRRAIIARPGYKFISIDFKAMEFRMACSYGGEKALLEKIDQGHDPHQATADITGLTRKQAKTLTFALIYGAGIKKIAMQIGCSEGEAKSFKQQYFKALPGLEDFIWDVKAKAKKQGYIETWTKRKLYMEDQNSDYKMPNHLIQGGCADVAKIACVAVRPLLDTIGAHLVLVVHDELVCEVPEEHLSFAPQIADLMKSVCPVSKMDCSIEVGENLHDMESYEQASTAGECVPSTCPKEAQDA